MVMFLNKAYFASLLISVTVHVLLFAHATQPKNPGGRETSVRASQTLLRAVLVSTPAATEDTSVAVDRVVLKEESKPEPEPEPVAALPDGDDASEADGVANYYSASLLSQMPKPKTSLAAILADRGEQPTVEQASRGQVVIRLWINRSGNLDRLSVISSELPENLERAAVAAFGQMRFTPGEIDGIAVMTWVDVVLKYGDLAAPSLPAVQEN